jgi:hypothetical protein
MTPFYGVFVYGVFGAETPLDDGGEHADGF